MQKAAMKASRTAEVDGPASDLSQLMSAIERGNREAQARFWPLVYDELRRLAAQQLAREAPGLTLNATALVHEAYVRLGGNGGDQRWENRRHFFAAAAEAMRRILVDNARAKHAAKRGGDRQRQKLDEGQVYAPERAADLLALDEALDQLAEADPKAAELVKLRYFGGLSIPEVAAALQMSPRSADALWAYARAWLLEKLQDGER
jgi:RNA polymerase sigma factor (TIGR02999 family)